MCGYSYTQVIELSSKYADFALVVFYDQQNRFDNCLLLKYVNDLMTKGWPYQFCVVVYALLQISTETVKYQRVYVI